ncbi:MAG: sigma-E processing peptidase SpoIIGA [Oscillospiraceae bacterium]
MTVVYIDELFLLNLVVNYLLLLAAGRVTGQPLARLRMGLAAGGGAGYAAALFLPGCGFLANPLCKLAVAVGMVTFSFWKSRCLLRLVLVFLAVAVAFGGGIYALELLGNHSMTLENGVVTSALNLRVILLSSCVCYFVITLVFQRAARHGGRDLAHCRLRQGDKTVTLTALIDTGNTLTDPVTGRAVLVAEGERLRELLPAEVDLEHPVESMARLRQPRRFQLLPYRTVGVSCGMLLALRVERVYIGKTEYENLLVALSPTQLSDGGGYQALFGAPP